MLRELRISNFALIDRLTITFDPCLNILTGETGAGKTILINALNLVLGGRACADFIRTGEDSAEVEAAFGLDEGHPIHAFLEPAGYYITPGEDLIIRRVIFRSEKANRCYVNGHIAPVGLLGSIGSWLVDIHGQHEHQLLLNPAGHLEIVDRFGGLDEETDALSRSYQEYQKAQEEWLGLLKRKEESAREHELLSFQREEIDKARLAPGEEEELVKGRNLLVHAARIRELTRCIVQSLYESEGSISEKLGEAAGCFHELASLDTRFKPMEEAVNAILIQIEDTAHQVMEYESRQDFTPEHLEQIEERLEIINRLKKKYQRSFEEILNYRMEMEKRWQLLENYDERIQEARADMRLRWAMVSKHAARLSEKRKFAAKRIEEDIEAQLSDLHMPRSRFVVAFSDPPAIDSEPPPNMGPRGWDEVEFLFSANTGEEPKSLVRIASGGEVSRVMLAFKSCLAMADQVLTLVFDEIDTGIGGSAAVTVGQKMKQLAAKRQIICITHLPQIASNATSHFLVSKKEAQGRTVTAVERLDRSGQIRELAKMIAGDGQSEIAIRHATEILEKSGNC